MMSYISSEESRSTLGILRMCRAVRHVSIPLNELPSLDLLADSACRTVNRHL
jgi:hypothetical protein